MDDSVRTFLEIVGFTVALVGQGWVIVRYVLDTIDSEVKNERQERHEAESTMKAELSSFRHDHVRRDDFLLHMESIHKQVDNLVSMVNSLTTTVDTRLDTIMSMLARGGKHD